ncbi:hypothetical protein D9M71_628730 [compost metagenome]
MALGRRPQGSVPAQGPGGGEALPAAHAWLGPCRVHLSQQGLARRARVGHRAIEQGLGQHHAPLIAIAVDADVAVLAVEQSATVAAFEHIKGLVGIVGANQQHRPYGDRLVPRFPERRAQATVVIDGQGQFRLERERPHGLHRTPLAALGFGAVVVDGSYQLAFATGVGGVGEQGEQGDEAQGGNARKAKGLAHGANSSDGVMGLGARTGVRAGV